MTRIEHIRNHLANVNERFDRLKKLIAHPNFGRLPAIECELLRRDLDSMVDLVHVLRARYEFAQRLGEPDELEIRPLGLADWLSL